MSGEHPLHAAAPIAEPPPARFEGERIAASGRPPTATEAPGGADCVTDASELRQLRALLFQSEIDRIGDLEQRLNDRVSRAREVGDVLSEAVVARSGQDTTLHKVFAPIVENSLKDSLKQNPNAFINIFFPLIGSTIRRSISESFNSMLSGFSKNLEHSLSLRGLKWRLEAFRTGKPYSEIVMLHTLVYRVEQVFLIHTETGLVLSHVTGDGVTGKDADMVSGMLTAIQDFARDCFSREGENSSLSSLKMDAYTIYLVQGPMAYIACVVQGTPPGDFVDRLSASLELITAECAGLFDGFDGDSTPFAVANKCLQDCLIRKFVNDDKPAPMWMKWAVAGAGILIVSLACVRQFHTWNMDSGVDILRDEPGILVMNVRKPWGFGPWQVVCLQDDAARPPERVLSEHGYDPDDISVNTIPFISREPNLVKRRVEKKIAPPAGVSVDYRDGVLILSGKADMDWILKATQIAEDMSSIDKVDTSRLYDPRVDELKALVELVETASVHFPPGSDIPIPSDQRALDRLIADLVSLDHLSREMGLAVNLTIYGQADATGSDRRNYEISQSRARTIASRLFSRQVNIPIAIYGIGADLAHGDATEKSTGESQSSRRIDVKVRLVKLTDADQLPVLRN